METAARSGRDLPDPRAILDHLQKRLGAGVTAIDELDVGVLQVRRREQPDWVLRAFPQARPLAAVEGDAEILDWLSDADFPAEHLASAEPVALVDGCPVLITEYVQPVPREERRETIRAAGGLRRLGELLGELSARETPPGAPSRPGGAWHHLADGHPRNELARAHAEVEELALSASQAQRVHLDALLAALGTADSGDGLPEAFIHPDFVLANVVATPDERMILVDWAGAGRGPRAWPLAFLLWAEATKNPARIGLVLAGYRGRVRLDAEERARLTGLIRARPLTITAWRAARGDLSASQAAAAAASVCEQADAVAARAVAVLDRAAGRGPASAR